MSSILAKYTIIVLFYNFALLMERLSWLCSRGLHLLVSIIAQATFFPENSISIFLTVVAVRWTVLLMLGFILLQPVVDLIESSSDFEGGSFWAETILNRRHHSPYL